MFRNIATLAIEKSSAKEKATIRDSVAPGTYRTDTLLVSFADAAVEYDSYSDSVVIRAYRSDVVRHSATTTVKPDSVKRTSSAFPTVAVLAELVATLHATLGHEAADAHLRRIARTCRPMGDNGTGVSDTGPSPVFVGKADAEKAAQSGFGPMRRIARATLALWNGVTRETERETRGAVSVKGGFAPLARGGFGIVTDRPRRSVLRQRR